MSRLRWPAFASYRATGRVSVGAAFQLGGKLGIARSCGIPNTSLISLTWRGAQSVGPGRPRRRKDWNVVRYASEGDFVLVTNNASVFRELVGRGFEQRLLHHAVDDQEENDQARMERLRRIELTGHSWWQRDRIL